MFEVFDDLPIIACSTGLSQNAAIGVIRISGFIDILELQPFFNTKLENLEPNYVKYCKLQHDGKFYDDVVITFFKGPNSYNAENILEISVHGNILNIKRILNLFTDNSNIRLANNGEFTYRALKNGKLTLSQVEGLDSLLNATSSSMLDQGLDLLHGDLFKRYLELRGEFTKLRSNVELNIDFLEDIGEEQGNKLLDESVNKVGDLIKSLLDSATVDKANFLSPNIVFYGLPNAGKSSLFNNILSKDRAIVSDVEGTTRDYISEYINIDGLSFNLVDTAGLRETKNKIEESGIAKAKDLISEAFLKIQVVNIGENFSKVLKETDAELIIFTHVDTAFFKFTVDEANLLEGRATIFCDLKNVKKSSKIYGSMGALESSLGPIEPGSFYAGPIEPIFKNGPIGAEYFFGPTGANQKSGPIGADKDGPIEPIISHELRSILGTYIVSKFNHLNNVDPILIDRQRDLINEISSSYEEFQAIYQDVQDIGIISSEINNIDNKISRLIGITTPDDVLQNIFSNFCIGK